LLMMQSTVDDGSGIDVMNASINDAFEAPAFFAFRRANSSMSCYLRTMVHFDSQFGAGLPSSCRYQ
jgi:hypothetical protein